MDLEKGLEEGISKRIKNLLDERKKEENYRDQHSKSIFEVPDDIRSPNFQKTIRIGLIYQKWHLENDDVKIRYMYDLFEGLKSPPDDIRNECVHRVYSKFNQTMACYGYNSDTVSAGLSDLCLIIVVDACYILSLIYKWSQYVKHKGSSYSDELLSSHQTKCDLIVLDNQIPFFVLQDIFECTILKLDPTASLVKLILSFLKDAIPFEANSITGHHGAGDTDYKHILDLLYKYYQPTQVCSSDRLSTVTRTYSAVELAKAGVKFKPNQDKMAITFESSWGNPTLTMPAMRIDESTTPVLWNLTVYERCYPEVGNYIASYAFAMMMIANTQEDLLKLGESKIIRNLSGPQYIMDLIHDLRRGVVLTEFSFAKDLRSMDAYYNSCLGYTRRTYFSGAWSYIALVAAFILFILNMIQTYCDIRGF